MAESEAMNEKRSADYGGSTSSSSMSSMSSMSNSTSAGISTLYSLNAVQMGGIIAGGIAVLGGLF
ncbi:9662_t:CDS:1, partial [Dentiscutata heterogama]